MNCSTNIFRVCCSFLLLTSVLFSACKRTRKGDPVPSLQLIKPTDSPASMIQKELDALTNFATSTSFVMEDICGAKVDTIQKSPKIKVVLTFNSNVECVSDGNKIRRSGKVTLERNSSVKWTSKNGQIDFSFNNFTIYKSCDTCGTKVLLVKVNGNQRRINVTGGDNEKMIDGDSIQHKLTAENLSYKFADSSERLQNIAQKITFRKVGSNNKVFINGDTVYKGIANVGIWGKIWNNKEFYVVYRKAKEYNSCSGRGKVVAGEVFYQKGNIQETEIFGVDALGISVNNCDAIGFLLRTRTAEGNLTEQIYTY